MAAAPRAAFFQSQPLYLGFLISWLEFSSTIICFLLLSVYTQQMVPPHYHQNLIITIIWMLPPPPGTFCLPDCVQMSRSKSCHLDFIAARLLRPNKSHNLASYHLLGQVITVSMAPVWAFMEGTLVHMVYWTIIIFVSFDTIIMTTITVITIRMLMMMMTRMPMMMMTILHLFPKRPSRP